MYIGLYKYCSGMLLSRVPRVPKPASARVPSHPLISCSDYVALSKGVIDERRFVGRAKHVDIPRSQD